MVPSVSVVSITWLEQTKMFVVVLVLVLVFASFFSFAFFAVVTVDCFALELGKCPF